MDMLSLIDGISESAIPVVSPNAKDEVKIIYANIRGLRQGAAQLRHRVATFSLMFVVLTETHLDGDSLHAERMVTSECCNQVICGVPGLFRD